jgi:Xaa-Pro aminopeptidase
VSSSNRAERLAALLPESGLDQLLVGDLVRPGDSTPDAIANLRWLTGFSGTSGLALVGAEVRVFWTDFRYLQRAQREVAGEFEQATAERELLEAAAKRLGGRVGYDDAHTSVKSLRELEQLVSEEVELVAAGGLVERLRRHKDAGELSAIADAAQLADEVYGWIFDRGVVGRTEQAIMLDAHQRMRELGADDPSFPAIVAAGENSALPHHSSSDREVGAAELLLVDMGAVVDGYCSDCTRTVATGELDDEAREVYDLVCSSQAKALEAVRANVAARDADSAARDPIARAGHGERFGHGLGHGVGLEVHEAPRVSQRSDEALEAGDVITVEPGVYLPGRFGVRIEDLVTVTEDGCRNFSAFPKQLTVLDS